MSIASADLRKAINTVWDDSTLDATFQALWKSGTVLADFEVLNDQEAMSKQPFPYCVFEVGPGTTTDRMTGERSVVISMPGSVETVYKDLREIRDIPCHFHVHTRAVSGDNRTAAEIAAYLVEEITKVFGGHPSETPTGLTLDNGNFLITQYQNDWGIRTGDDEYQWNLSYLFRLDVPVAV